MLAVYPMPMENSTAEVLSPHDLEEVYHGFKEQVWALGANVIVGWRRVPRGIKILYLPSVVLKKAARRHPQLMDPERFIDSERKLAGLTKAGCTVTDITLGFDIPDGPEVVSQINGITRRGALGAKRHSPTAAAPAQREAPREIPVSHPVAAPDTEASDVRPWPEATPAKPPPAAMTAPPPEPVAPEPVAPEPVAPAPVAPAPVAPEPPPRPPAPAVRAPLLSALLGRRAKPAKPGEANDIVLGVDSANGEEIAWNLSVRSNPHMMIAGLPGMGKTTCLINLCTQLQRHGITPIVFSYHQDIDERLEETIGKLNYLDYDGLGFNPMQIDEPLPTAHIDTASEIRDIFSAIFPDLGEVQSDNLRQAILQSFTDLGWGGDAKGKGRKKLSSPSFQSFFDNLKAQAKPDRGLMARLSELNDYGFFDADGKSRSPLDVKRTTILRIHGTSNELLQRAFASFVLYSIYKEMFRRGLQKRLTHVVVFDEAHRASRLKLIPTMAKECRKYGLSLVLASQEARDFDPSLFSAIATYLCMRVTEQDAKFISRNVVASDIEKQTIDALKQLAKYKALFFREGDKAPSHVALTG